MSFKPFEVWWMKHFALSEEQMRCDHYWEGYAKDGNFYNYCGICQKCGIAGEADIDGCDDTIVAAWNAAGGEFYGDE